MDNDPQYRTGDNCMLRIWADASKNNFHSEQEGRPIFDDVIMLEVIAPGSNGASPVFEVERIIRDTLDADKVQIIRAPQYEQYVDFINRFKANAEDMSLAGTPLKEWSEISRSKAAELKAAGITSVETLAALSDNQLHRIGPDGRTWRDKAVAYLANSKDDAYATELAARLAKSEENNADKDRQLRELNDRLSALEATGTKAPTKAGTKVAGDAPDLSGAPDDII